MLRFCKADIREALCVLYLFPILRNIVHRPKSMDRFFVSYLTTVLTTRITSWKTGWIIMNCQRGSLCVLIWGNLPSGVWYDWESPHSPFHQNNSDKLHCLPIKNWTRDFPNTLQTRESLNRQRHFVRRWAQGHHFDTVSVLKRVLFHQRQAKSRENAWEDLRKKQALSPMSRTRAHMRSNTVRKHLLQDLVLVNSGLIVLLHGE